MTLLFFDFGSGEILLILLVVFLIFGPDKIPELARSIGKVINDVKRASEDIKTEINKEADRKDREKRLEEYKSKIALQDNDVSTDEKPAAESEKPVGDSKT
ncbi:MAG: twin-arginine translocase TatA/TatE family subunit [Chlorobi bacterium]|nr:twin-arginine translocase TatA/TatE family subunit [Chlorobiota bacterium]